MTPARVPSRCVHYLESATYGGCERVVLTTLANMDRRRWHPVLLHHADLSGTRVLDEAKALGVTTVAHPRIDHGSAAGYVAAFSRALKALHADVFHAHLGWPLACRHGILAARLARVPRVVATAHLYVPIREVRWGALKQRLQAAVLDRYIAVSTEVARRLESDLRVPQSRIRVVRNGIDLDPFEAAFDPQLRFSLDGGSSAPLILTPARLHSQKGHEVLLEAVPKVPEALFVFAGDGPARERLEARARQLGVSARVRFLGLREDVPQLLASCDLVVLPSWYEGLPLAVLEAMAAGKPVVATAVGGTDEAAVDGVCGRLVEPGNVDALAAAINSTLADRTLMSRYALAGRSRARELFDANAMVRGVERVYDELLPQPAPAASQVRA